MCPDDPRFRIMPHQDFHGLVIRMGVQIEIVGHREVDGLLHPLVFRRLARQMKLADAAVIAAFEFVLHEIEDDGIAEPAADVGADPVGPDERHHLQAVRFGIDQRMGAGIGTAGGKDAGDAMLFEQRQHFVELVERLRFPIVVQVRVEDFDRFGGASAWDRGRKQARGDQDGEAPAKQISSSASRHYSAATTCGRSTFSASSACGSRRRLRRRSMRSR